VLRGYVGDRQAKPVFPGSSPFDILGTGYQRPFELASLRLANMVGILPKCECAALPACAALRVVHVCTVYVGGGGGKRGAGGQRGVEVSQQLPVAGCSSAMLQLLSRAPGAMQGASSARQTPTCWCSRAARSCCAGATR
jgi:hypothetical protein